MRWWVLVLGGCSLEARLDGNCRAYCDQLATCDGDLDEDACVADCQETGRNCQADELEAVVDDLDTCADETCDEIGACGVGVLLQCYLGV